MGSASEHRAGNDEMARVKCVEDKSRMTL